MSNEMGLFPPNVIGISRGPIDDATFAKLALWLKFEPIESRKALRYGNPKFFAEYQQRVFLVQLELATNLNFSG